MMKQIEKAENERVYGKLETKPLTELEVGKLVVKAETQVEKADFSDPQNYFWNKSLPGCGYEVVSVLAGNGFIYAGSNGYVYKLDASGNILATNNLPGRGNHEVRLALTNSYLVVGTDGYVVLVSLSDFGNTNRNINISLPGCGYEVVSVLTDSNYIYAGSNGYVYKLSVSGSILATNDLPGRGNRETRLALTNTNLVVGTNGYVVMIPINNFSSTNSNINISLPGCGYEVVSVLTDGNYIYAGSNGYVYKLSSGGSILATNGLPGMGNHEIRLALTNTNLVVGTNGYAVLLPVDDFGNTSRNINVSLPGCSYYVVSVSSEDGHIYAGSNGYVYELSGTTGEVMMSNGLPGLGYHEIRLDSSNHQLYVGTNGYLAAPEKIVVLNMNLIGQKTNMWCWAAGGQMVMKYLGKDISQCEQANYRLGFTNCCVNPTPSQCIQGGWPDFLHWGFNADETTWGQALSFANLKNQFDSSIPVCFSWGWTGGGGHLMVARGYSALSQMILVNDPWPLKEGETKWISYNAYVSGSNYSHWRDYYNISKLNNLKKYTFMHEEEHSNTVNNSFSDPREAAGHGLNMSFYLENDSYHLDSRLSNIPNAYKHLEIKDYLKVYFIRHDTLKIFTETKPLETLLVDQKERKYPVFFKGKAKFAVTIRENEDGRWMVASLGDSKLIKIISSILVHISGKENYFIVNIPSLYYVFLAHFNQDNVLKFIHIYDNKDKHFNKGQEQDASEVLSAIKSEAINEQFPLNYNGQ